MSGLAAFDCAVLAFLGVLLCWVKLGVKLMIMKRAEAMILTVKCIKVSYKVLTEPYSTNRRRSDIVSLKPVY
jgi:hypothetical protein